MRRRSDQFTHLKRYNLRVGSYFKVLFVRDPLDRLVSTYYSKFASKRTRYWSKVNANGRPLSVA